MPGVLVTSALVVGGWGYFLCQGVTEPLGGVYPAPPALWQSNQLLAVVALAVAITILIKMGKLNYVWSTVIPLVVDAANTLKASYHKTFFTDPKLGLFSQASGSGKIQTTTSSSRRRRLWIRCRV